MTGLCAQISITALYRNYFITIPHVWRLYSPSMVNLHQASRTVLDGHTLLTTSAHICH